MALRHLYPLHPHYPTRLRDLRPPPPLITLSGGPLEADATVAIVGSRAATPEAITFARELAGHLVRAAVVIVSGGALGIDTAAHEGALAAGGRTWVVAGTGHERCYPPENADLFARVARGPSAMVWPFAPDYQHRRAFPARNLVLAALADAMVVVQAGPRSGALHAASRARLLGKPLWVVAASPWDEHFGGSHQLLEEGAWPIVCAKRWAENFGARAGYAPAATTPSLIPVAAAHEHAHARLLMDPWLAEGNFTRVKSLAQGSPPGQSNGPPWLPTHQGQGGGPPWLPETNFTRVKPLGLEHSWLPGNFTRVKSRIPGRAWPGARTIRAPDEVGEASTKALPPASVPLPLLGPASPAPLRSANETAVLSALGRDPLHLDSIASRGALAVAAAHVALLTLALEDVVVEGPPGFFRRRD